MNRLNKIIQFQVIINLKQFGASEHFLFNVTMQCNHPRLVYSPTKNNYIIMIYQNVFVFFS